MARDARGKPAAVLALAPRQFGQSFLLRRVRWLPQATALESVLVRHPRFRHHRPLRDALRSAATDLDGLNMSTSRKSIGIVGARGHTGAELIRLIAAHPALELAFVSSRELDGQRVSEHSDAYTGELRYENLAPAAVAAKRADVVILALPNGKAA